MARSYSWSLLIHLLLLLALFLGAVFIQSEETAPEESKVVMRPMELTRPEKPEMQAGSSVQPEPHSDPRPNDQPELVPPLPEPDVPEPKPQRESEAEPKEQVASTQTAAEPQFLIEAPEYPTYQPNSDGEGKGNAGPDALNLRGETALEDRPAIPYYHPAVTLDGVVGRDWILVRFEVEANGRFDVEILDGTGNIHQDARVLNVLRRWKWQPMQIDGQTYRSIEVVRLYRRDIRPM